MPASCAALLAGLCVLAPYDKATDLQAMYAYSDGVTGIAQPAAMETLGVHIVAAQSDNIFARDTAGLARACAGDLCILYLKTCTPDGLTCEVDWGRAGAPFDTTTFWISANSAAAMARASAAMSLVLSRDGKHADGQIPVVQLSQVAALPYLPPCVDHDGPDCVTLMNGRVPAAPATASRARP
jgi:hypothetical protein